MRMLSGLCRSRGTMVLAVALTLASLAGPATARASAAAARAGDGGDHRACRNGYVGLTYDDGPTAATTQPLLAALRAAHARATFFDLAANARQSPELVRAQQRAGMWIGNHTYSHPHLTQIGEPAAFQEIASTQEVLRLITGRAPVLFREPFGETNDQVRADIASLRLLEVLWTVDSRDWAGATTAEIVAAAATLRPGGIILMHDWAQASIDAVPRIVADLAARGLCPGRIAFTPDDVSGAGQIFHAVAVAP